MIDVHAHFLPAVDDGPKTWDETLAMVRIAYQDGIRTIFCTSHLNADTNPCDEFMRRIELVNELQTKASAEFANIKFYPGAEWVMSYDLLDVLPRYGCLGESQVFLFELTNYMPLMYVPDFLNEINTELHKKALLAHPERHRRINPENFKSMLSPIVDKGCTLQVTAGSLLGHFGMNAHEVAVGILQTFPHNTVLSSDAHNLDFRPPILSEAFHYAESLAEGLANKLQSNLRTILEF